MEEDLVDFLVVDMVLSTEGLQNVICKGMRSVEGPLAMGGEYLIKQQGRWWFEFKREDRTGASRWTWKGKAHVTSNLWVRAPATTSDATHVTKARDAQVQNIDKQTPPSANPLHREKGT